MVLDYVLDHLGTRFLPRSSDKRSFFSEALGISSNLFSQRVFSGALDRSQPNYFPNHLPVAVLPGQDGEPALLSFAFVDHGHQTLKPFRAFVAHYAPLFRALVRFEIVYVADSNRNFRGAGRLFCELVQGRRDALMGLTSPRDINHFLDYLQVRRLFEDDPNQLTFDEVHILREGESLYKAPSHEEIYVAWKKGHIGFDEIRTTCQRRSASASIRGYLLKTPYPFCGPKYQGAT